MNHLDSDEEPPAAAAAVATTVAQRPSVLSASSGPQPHSFLSSLMSSSVDGSPYDALGRCCVALERRCDLLSTLPMQVPAVVPFCVGGKDFAVSRKLLEKDPGSLLFSLAAHHYTTAYAPGSSLRDTPRPVQDSPRKVALHGAIALPDRNPLIFGMLLNFLRGYRNAISEDWMDSCYDEATYYGLSDSWAARFPHATSRHYFRNPLQDSKLTSEAVLGIASDYMGRDEHHIDFSVSQCDRVGVGLMSSGGGTADDASVSPSDGGNGAFYWNDGRVSLYVGDARVVETGFPFPAGTIIRVVFDADARIVRWITNGELCVAMERLPAGRQYAFASIAARNSHVTIVEV